ncbi:MAG: PorV/PorQ family protein [Candidatus Firestonebacteria bacterium]
MKTIKAVVLTAAFAALTYAGVGTSGGFLLDTCPGARPSARGNAFVAASDVYSINYNPGALAGIENTQIGVMYIKGTLDTGYEYGAFVLPIRKMGVLGLSVFAFQGGTMDITDSLGNTSVKSAQNDYLFSCAFGMSNILLKNFDAGVTAKYLMSSLAETYNAAVFTFDLGGTYKMENLTFGFAAYNLIGGLKYIEVADNLPVSGRMGTEYLFAIDTEHELTAAVDVAYNNEKTVKVFMGAEYSYVKSFFGRVGYRLNDGDGGLSLGVGCRGTILEDSVQSIDYAFIPSLNGLMDSHRISVGITFGEQIKNTGTGGEKKKFFTPKRIVR